MSRYPKENTTDVYTIVPDWRDRCLIDDGSIFREDEELWTGESIQDLVTYYVDNPDLGEGGFIDKLEGQLGPCGPDVKKLAAEMRWVLLLSPSNIGPPVKRASICQIWNWSGDTLSPDEPLLADAVLSGIGSGGTAFNVAHWVEFAYFISLMREFKSLSIDHRKALLGDPWRFGEWLEGIEGTEKRQFRLMLLHLLFPDVTERIFSRGNRHKVLVAFTKLKLSEVKKLSNLEKDKRIYEIRKEQEAIHNTDKLDFYEAPLNAVWKWREPKRHKTTKSSRSSPADQVAEAGAEYGIGPKLGNGLDTRNLIFYGPPGTGKTYHTVNQALEILDPEFMAEYRDNRHALTERFNELRDLNRIGFVTFHQSFSYEDFVEGLKATTNEDDQVEYVIEDGVFKKLCISAASTTTTSIEKAIELFVDDIEESETTLKTVRGKSFSAVYRGGKTIRVRPEATSQVDADYGASINNIIRLYRGGKLSEMYNPSYVQAILNHLYENYDLDDETDSASDNPHVLIIDEINRGNIANIFGELITLIEPSKRAGAAEALEVTLPYSKEKFSVPANLHIIGTMNTADRSLAYLDTALRRRFQFQEMMPDPALLKQFGVETIEGINLVSLLTTINARIELLYDREHTLGHSFFLKLVDDQTIEQLADIFQFEILPLLEEYFFEDWGRIRQVLGDDQKISEDLQFIIPAYRAEDLTRYLGSEVGADQLAKAFKRNPDALKNPQAYISSYQSASQQEDA